MTDRINRSAPPQPRTMRSSLIEAGFNCFLDILSVPLGALQKTDAAYLYKRSYNPPTVGLVNSSSSEITGLRPVDTGLGFRRLS